MAVTVRPVTEAVGAEISGVDLRSLSDQDFVAIERAWTRHSMVQQQIVHRKRLPDVEHRVGDVVVVAAKIADRAVAEVPPAIPTRSGKIGLMEGPCGRGPSHRSKCIVSAVPSSPP